MTQRKGIVLTGDGDLAVTNGHLQIGDTLLQDASLILGLTQGDLKEDPLCGANLLRHIRGQADRTAIERTVKIQLERAGIDYEEVKEQLTLKLNNHEESN